MILRGDTSVLALGYAQDAVVGVLRRPASVAVAGEDVERAVRPDADRAQAAVLALEQHLVLAAVEVEPPQRLAAQGGEHELAVPERRAGRRDRLLVDLQRGREVAVVGAVHLGPAVVGALPYLVDLVEALRAVHAARPVLGRDQPP